MGKVAHFWFAPGVEVMPDFAVPDPSPPTYRFAVREPMDVLSDGQLPSEIVPIQMAQFRLANDGRGGEVVHYVLDSQPRYGWRWLVVDGSIRAERTESVR